MRFFIFSVLIIVLASCGTMRPNGHLRFVKVGQNEVPVIEKNTAKVDEIKESEEAQQEAKNELASIEAIPEVATDLQNQILVENSSKTTEEFEDLEPEEDEVDVNQQIVDQAIRAEKQAKFSVGLFGVGLISIVMPYLGIFFYIAGIILYSNAKSSRYITPFGENRLGTSKTLLIIDSVILGLWLLLFLLVLTLLFL